MAQGHPASSSATATGAGELPTGFQVIHANRLEDLRALVVEVIRRFPLAPLDDEVFLVHSNGIAQWLKLALARDTDDPELPGLGIAAGMTFSLPSRFLWQVYRAVLGEEAVAAESPYDKSRLTWRLLRLLPELVSEPVYAPLGRFLGGQEGDRRLHQLAERIADLFDQYQVYRADWLEAWRQGRDVMTRRSQEAEVPGDQRWQPALWRALVADIGEVHIGNVNGDASRADIHNHFLQAAAGLDTGNRPQGLPRRLVVFGVSSLPQQTLEVLSQLGRCTQVLLCVHNPCQFFWADIVEDRELLRATNHRGRRREGMPAVLDDHNLHLHAHPLLAAWGKQGRDYIRLLDEYDNQADYRHWFDRIDLFESPVESAEGDAPLLRWLQDDILNLRPVSESRRAIELGTDDRPATDPSIAFHVAHSPQREVEILHDQLLQAFGADPSLRPQDVIVMVPDINAYAPNIQAVFGRIDADDDRYIPYTISDQGERHRQPMLVALEKLLSLPEARLGVSEVLDLLDVPAVRSGLALKEEDLPQLHNWIQGANIRWGLNASQRASLDLPEGVEQNTWLFGLRRMLLGYVVGDGDGWQGIEPYGEIGGLESRLAGQLDALIHRLERFWRALSESHTPAQWVDLLNRIRLAFFGELDEEETLILSRLEQGVELWLDACVDAGLADTPLPLTIVREAWLESLEQTGLSQRFLAGKVNFATLMPMRAIPFSHICLLGMNDGDYPRSYPPMDFDLMAQDYRPGDRSRREDDRYLFLEALLSARKSLYISWVGRSINDNSERPPSVLVAQLRDHLDAIRPVVKDGKPVAEELRLTRWLTTEHPLQPFSPRYFLDQDEGRLFTYASEWRQAHGAEDEDKGAAGKEVEFEAGIDIRRLPDLPEGVLEEPVTLALLAGFLRNPVATFFRQRLGVSFFARDVSAEDDEPLVLDGLGHWKLTDELINLSMRSAAAENDDLDGFLDQLHKGLARQTARGDFPVGGVGELLQRQVAEPLPELYERYRALLAQYPQALDLQQVDEAFVVNGLEIPMQDWIDQVRGSPDGDLALVSLQTSGLTTARNRYKWTHLLKPWISHLAACMCQPGPVTSFLLSKAGDITLPPLPAAQARDYLQAILAAWLEAWHRPLPLAAKTGFAWLDARHKGEDKALADARAVFEGGFQSIGEGEEDPALGRAWASFEDLAGDGEFNQWAEALYLPLWQLVKDGKGS